MDKDVATRIVEAIRADLDDRQGMWPDDLDEDTEEQILIEWAAIVRREMERP